MVAIATARLRLGTWHVRRTGHVGSAWLCQRRGELYRCRQRGSGGSLSNQQCSWDDGIVRGDSAANQGGFQCVPGFHSFFDEWVKTQPKDRNSRQPDLNGLEVKSIPGKAGDLLIWHRLLAHGSGHNRSDKPRMAQYITMSQALGRGKEERQQRIKAWQSCRPTPRWPGDPRDWEHKYQKPAVLTDLGQKLLGLEPWN